MITLRWKDVLMFVVITALATKAVVVENWPVFTAGISLAINYHETMVAQISLGKYRAKFGDLESDE